MRRWIWEALVAAALISALLGVWQWSQMDRDRRLARQAEVHAQELSATREAAEAWAGSLAKEEAATALSAFAAGIHPQALAGRRESLDGSVGEFVILPWVSFVHVLTPDGQVQSSSDRRLMATGQADERAQWALSVEELSFRQAAEGVTELAMPVHGVSEPVVILWMGYRTGALMAKTRPAGWS